MSATTFNLLVIPTVVVAMLLFSCGVRWERRLCTRLARVSSLVLSLPLALPALAMAACYVFTRLENSALYCDLRSIPYSEFAAGGLGLPVGLLYEWLGGSRTGRDDEPRASGAGRWWLARPLLVGLGLLALLPPYAKPLLFPLDLSALVERWKDGVCLQSSYSTCGPAVTATLLGTSGVTASERELALECHSCSRGTENWYLARAFRQRGVGVQYTMAEGMPSPLPYPAVAGVRLGGNQGVGHYIAILGKQGNLYVVGEPLQGRLLLDETALARRYWFTGFFLVVRPPPGRPPA